MAGVRGVTWPVFRILMSLTAVAGVVQIFLAGRGVFGIRGSANLDHQSSLDPHRTLGDIIGIAAIVLFLLALILWNRRLIGWTALLVVLTEFVQHATATQKHPWLAGVHPVSGVAIVAILGWLSGSLWREARSASARISVEAG